MCNFHIWLCKYGKQNSNFILVIYAIFFLFQPTVTNKSVKNFLNRHINEGLKQNFHFDLELICILTINIVFSLLWSQKVLCDQPVGATDNFFCYYFIYVRVYQAITSISYLFWKALHIDDDCHRHFLAVENKDQLIIITNKNIPQ